MNYLAHGRRFVDQPYVLAGTAVPDWLNVVNRRARARGRLAAQFVDDADPQVANVARGIIQHHHDDKWFHLTRAFVELSSQFTVAIRDILHPDDSFRPSFLGHILVELLLDASLIEDDPYHAEDYYCAIDRLDPHVVSVTVNRMTTQPVEMLDSLIRRFSSDRFLYDYLEDAKLLERLSHVMRRVKLAPLPDSLLPFFPQARQQVRDRQRDLLNEPSPP